MRPSAAVAPPALLAAIALSLALHLRAEYFGPAWQVYLFKPLTTSLVILLALGGRDAVSRAYRGLIVTGLGFSLCGDVFLMLPGDRFVAGLASFLVAHLWYIAAFATHGGARITLRLLTPYVLYDVALMGLLWPRLGALTVPVAVYGAVLCAMGWQALARWRWLRTGPSAAAALGGALFIVSDSVLALNRFVAAFAAARLLIMATYIAAQCLIARSVRDP